MTEQCNRNECTERVVQLDAGHGEEIRRCMAGHTQ